MSVGPNGAIPVAENVKRGLLLLAVGYLPSVKRLLERAEEAFDALVLPGTAGLDSLVANAGNV